jgi:hypothetical protein
MKTFTFVIGSMDDFESVDELMAWAEAEASHEGSIYRNAQYWEFDCPDDCSEELVTMIGRGYAFSSDWCEDHTFSFFVKGELSDTIERPASDEVQNHDLWEIK